MRATEQWFADVSKLQERAINAVDHVKFTPESGRKRIKSMLLHRGDWCISRQRVWGLPLPIFYDKETGRPLINEETVEWIAQIFQQRGSEVWWSEADTNLLLPPQYRSNPCKYRRGRDTIDVWFDSGSSWSSILEPLHQSDPSSDPSSLSSDPSSSIKPYLCDAYVEGTDQHRGWFQSSLLTCVGVTGRAPYKSIITHGFVVDERGEKMSKSIGNVVAPKEVIEGSPKMGPPRGIDVLRLWAAATDFTTEVSIGPQVISLTAEFMHRIRNTLRFSISNLFDFDEPPLPFSQLPPLERYMLHLLDQLQNSVTEAYERHEFRQVVALILEWCQRDLSNFYFESIKDRLYTDLPSSHSRLSVQTVLFHVRFLFPSGS